MSNRHPAARRALEGAVGCVANRDDRPLDGQPIPYLPRDFDFGRSWELLTPKMRAWAEGIAGAKIRDPHTGEEQYYWACRVRLQREAPGPGSPNFAASYDLWLFGKNGLATARGTAQCLVDSAGQTKWRSEGRRLPIDAPRVRCAHLSSGKPGILEGGQSGSAVDQPSSPLARFVPRGIALWLGNLPAETQRFLIEPFASDGRPAQDGNLDAITVVLGSTYEERYRGYLFNSQWVSVFEASRAVPYRSGLVGPALWNHSPEAKQIAQASWTVAAWVAPVQKAGTSVENGSPLKSKLWNG